MVFSSIARRSLPLLLAIAILSPGLVVAQSISVGGRQTKVSGCKGSLELFQRTGSIECGNLVWDLHPEDARRIEKPAEYLAGYEKYYQFMKDLTGLAPTGKITIHERCKVGEEVGGPEDCPKGVASFTLDVFTQGNEVFIDPLIARAMVFASSHDKRPPVQELAVSIGKLFVPSATAARAYRWGQPMLDAWDQILPVYAYLMAVEQEGAVPFYFDYYCRVEMGNAPCDKLMDSFDAMAAIGADGALAGYVSSKDDFKWLVPVPPGDMGDVTRTLEMVGMLAALYREANEAGQGKQFLQGLGALVRYYEKGFPYPSSWRQNGPLSQAQLDKRAEIFVFLLSASAKRNFTKRFVDWGWPISSLTRVSVPVLEAMKWDEALKLKILKSLLAETAARKLASPAVPAIVVPGVRSDSRPPTVVAGARGVVSGAVPATPNIEQVQSKQRGVENGASIPEPGSGGGSGPAAQSGGLLGGILDAIQNAIQNVAKPKGAPAGGGSGGEGAEPEDEKTVNPTFLGIEDIQNLGDVTIVCDQNGKCREVRIPPAYVRLEGPLFVKGKQDYDAIHPDDVKQGSLGDCYLLAALAAVALSDGQAIRDMFKDNGGGNYTVYLYSKTDKQWWQFWEADFKRDAFDVNNEFPMNKNGTIFAQQGTGDEAKELWVLLAEKAYAAKHQASYDAIGHGGWPGDALEEISGKRSDRRDAAAVLLRQLQSWYDKKTAVTTWTPGDDSDKAAQVRAKNLVPMHAYYMEKADNRQGFVAIANPWGWGEEHISLTEKEFRDILVGVHSNAIR